MEAKVVGEGFQIEEFDARKRLYFLGGRMDSGTMGFVVVTRIGGGESLVKRGRGAARREGSWICSLRQADVVVVGGGGVGLSTALEVAQKGAEVVVVGKQLDQGSATWAAAGMLAPQAERLEDGPLLSLCLKSRELYPEFIEELTRRTGLEVPFDNSGRFLGPILPSEDGPRKAPNARAGRAQWFNSKGLRSLEPSISEKVVGAWQYGEDCAVDNRRLYEALHAACEAGGVRFLDGHATGISMRKGGQSIDAVRLQDGQLVRGKHFVIAAGSWTRKLLSVPVRPVKGQMVRLTPPVGSIDGNALSSVLFADSVYIVPRSDGSIVVGATVEDIGFKEGVTAGGISSLLLSAIDLVPSLSTYTICETWYGYRPTTPDFMPILGQTKYENASVATGHHRNGILLLPITAKLMANIATGSQQESAETQSLLEKFSIARFEDGTGTAPVQSDKRPVQKNGISSYPKVNGVVNTNVPGEQMPSAVSTYTTKPSGIPVFGAEEEAKWKDAVMVWKVEKDGSETPLKYKEGVQNFEKGYGHLQSEEGNPGSAQEEAAPAPMVEPKNEVKQSQSSAGSQVPQAMGGMGNQSTDAYDDILVLRDNADDVAQRALFQNRTFGVNSTRVNAQGEKLSISDSEFDAFDVAAKAGQEDAELFRQHWRQDDTNDPSKTEHFY